MKPIIGITCGEIRNKAADWQPITHGQSQTYVNAVIDAGGVPVLLPMTDDISVLRPVYNLLDGLLMAGGNDVKPALYNQKPYPETTDYSELRDTTEQTLLLWALADKLPVLAICRGMQLSNVVCGGTLHQHIDRDVPGALDHDSSTKAQSLQHLAHELTLDPQSKLARILGTNTIFANSHHHQAVKTLGEGFTATAWTSDGVIEAIELNGADFFIGVQSHPESLYVVAEPRFKKLFAAHVEAAARSVDNTAHTVLA